MVVSAYHETGKNPWSELSPLTAAVQGPLEGGVAAEGIDRQHTNLRFKNVDAIGNPLAGLLSTVFAQSGLMCPSAARPFEPYFISTLDTLAWRFGIPEAVFPESLVPGVREIRGELGPLGTWGSVYPRSGFLVQAHDYKAAAVTAQRAANVITQRDQPHVYLPVVADPTPGYWPPGEARENDADSARWQMLLPRPENQCHVFAEIDDLNAGVADPYAERLDEHGDYVWNLWRPYECCEQAGKCFSSRSIFEGSIYENGPNIANRVLAFRQRDFPDAADASATRSKGRRPLLLHDWWRRADPAAGEHRYGDRHDRRVRRVGLESHVRGV